MKILFITDNFPPEVNAPASRTYEHCVEWQKQGAEVTVITCAPNFPQGRVYEGYRNKLYQEEQMDGLRVIRVWSYISANKGFLKRTLDYLSFGIAAAVSSLFVQADIIIATSPQFFAAVGGYAAAILKRRPWIMEVRDLWPESIKAVEAMRHNRAIDWLERLELHLYRKARNIVVVTDAFRDNMVARGIDPAKIHIVKNGVRMEHFRPAPKDEALVQELGLEGKFVLGYLGTHGMAHKLDFILVCALKAPENVHFLFIGDGAEKEKLLHQKEHLGLDNVTLLPPVPKAEVPRYLSITDAALVPLKRSDTFKTVIPSKIFENAAMEKPILLGVEGEAQAIIEQYGAGLCFQPENKEDFLEQARRLQSEPGLYAACQEGCRRLAQDFRREKLAGEMLKAIRGAVGR